MSCFFMSHISLLFPFLYEAWKPICPLPHSAIYSNKILSIFISLSFIFHSITPCLLSILQQLHILFCYFINKVIYGLLSSFHLFVYYFIIKVLKYIIPLVFLAVQLVYDRFCLRKMRLLFQCDTFKYIQHVNNKHLKCYMCLLCFLESLLLNNYIICFLSDMCLYT